MPAYTIVLGEISFVEQGQNLLFGWDNGTEKTVGYGPSQLPVSFFANDANYIDFATTVALYVFKSGDTMVGDLSFGSGAQILADSGVTSTAAPLPYTFVGDTDTGFYRKAANVMAFAAGATDIYQIQFGAVTGVRLFKPIFYSNSTTLPSATIMDIGAAATGQTIPISGTANIASLGSSAPVGSVFDLYFTGACTFINSANLIVQGGADYTVAVGDKGKAWYKTAGVWEVWFFPISGRAVVSDSATGPVFALTDAANIAVNLANGKHFSVTLGGNRTLQNPTNLPAGTDCKPFVVIVTQDATGGRTLAFDTLYNTRAVDTDINYGPNERTYLTFMARNAYVDLVGNAA